MTDHEPLAPPMPGPYDAPRYAHAWLGLGVVANALTVAESPLAENFRYLHTALVKMALEATVASLHRGHNPVAQLYRDRDAALFNDRAVPADNAAAHLEAQLQAVERNFGANALAVQEAVVVGYRDQARDKFVAWPLEFAVLPHPGDNPATGIRLVTTGGDVRVADVSTYRVLLQRLPADDQRRLAVYAAQHHLPEPNEVANNSEGTPA